MNTAIKTELLEFIASWELDYIVSGGLPATRMIITEHIGTDGKTYRKEIRKLKKEGLIRAVRVNIGDYFEEGSGLDIVGWELTEKARNLEMMKRIKKEVEDRIEQVFGSEFV